MNLSVTINFQEI